MDKDRLSRLIGLTLISFIVLLYLHFFPPQLPPAPPSPAATTDPIENKLPPLHDTVTQTQYGIWAPALQGTAQEIVLENDVLKVTLTSQGGRIKEVRLKHYQDHQQQPLVLLDATTSSLGLQWTGPTGTLTTQDLFFETTQDAQNPGGQVTFTLPLGPGQYLQQSIVLPESGYQLSYTWKIVGLAAHIDYSTLQFIWNHNLKQLDTDRKTSQNKATITYYLTDHTFHHLKERIDHKDEKTISAPIHWIGMKHWFFTAGLIAEEAFPQGVVALTPLEENTTTLKTAQVQLTIPATHCQAGEGTYHLYFGPNDYKTLKQVAPGFDQNRYMGWPIIRGINQLLIMPVFSFLERHFTNYGLIILLLVLIIKCLLFPLAYKSYLSMAKIKLLKPELDAIKAQYGDDLAKIQLEQINVYREAGINPMSGCIPVLLQMPILLAMFNFFPNATELRQQPFLWAKDLSTYDAILHLPFTIPIYGSHISLFTLLMTASTLLYTWSNRHTNTTQGPMQALSYTMPLLFMFILNTFPAGLCFYYCISNLVTFSQQLLIKYFVDEKKLQKTRHYNKRNRPKDQKSRVQTRIERTMQPKKTIQQTKSKNNE